MRYLGDVVMIHICMRIPVFPCSLYITNKALPH